MEKPVVDNSDVMYIDINDLFGGTGMEVVPVNAVETTPIDIKDDKEKKDGKRI